MKTFFEFRESTLTERNALNMTKRKAIIKSLGKAESDGKQMTRKGVDGVAKRITKAKKDKGDGGFKNNEKQKNIGNGRYIYKGSDTHKRLANK